MLYYPVIRPSASNYSSHEDTNVLEAVFEQYDANHDGYLDLYQMRALLDDLASQFVRLGVPCARLDTDSLCDIVLIDANGDWAISKVDALKEVSRLISRKISRIWT